jgi:hypothetical protein
VKLSKFYFYHTQAQYAFIETSHYELNSNGSKTNRNNSSSKWKEELAEMTGGAAAIGLLVALPYLFTLFIIPQKA